jgi:hypothetical protein
MTNERQMVLGGIVCSKVQAMDDLTALKKRTSSKDHL